ncbi:hypothetical protein Leryth_007743 [Lithospermum erythrorhizon]|nr:hypothetical protein Leryth_007743 [Lithospermum erythrorhizon]
MIGQRTIKFLRDLHCKPYHTMVGQRTHPSFVVSLGCYYVTRWSLIYDKEFSTLLAFLRFTNYKELGLS